MATSTKQPAKVKSKSEEQSQSDAEMWKQRFEYCEENQTKLFKRAQKYYDIMYAIMNTDNIAPWRSKVYVPILASKAWDLISRFSDIVPYFTVTVKNESEIDEETGQLSYANDAMERAEGIELALQDDYENTGIEPMQLKVFDTLLDAVVPGSGFAKTPWKYEENVSYGRKVDPTTGMIKDNGKVIKKTVRGGRNDFVPINFFNMFMPGKKKFFEQPYWIVREQTTIEDARTNPLISKGQLRKLLVNNGANTTFMQYNQSRDRLTMSTSITEDPSLKNINLYECYLPNGSVKIYGEGKSENGWVEVGKNTAEYWFDRPCIVPFYIRKKSFSPWGESLFENNARLQSAVNDLFNHYLDNWNLSIDQMLIYQDGTLVNDYVVRPGGEIVYTGSQAPTQFKFADPNPNQLSTVLGVIQQGIEAATVPQYLSGVPDSNLDKTGGTATGIKSITEAATEKVGFMRNNIKWSMKIVGKNWLSNLQQFEDRPREVRAMKDGIKRPVLVMPGDYQGELDLDIDDDSMTPTSQQQKLTNIQGYMAGLTQIQQLGIAQAQIFQTPKDIPRFNTNGLIDEYSKAYGYKDYSKYLLPNTIGQPQAVDNGTVETAATPAPTNGVPLAQPTAGGQQGAEQEAAQLQEA
jgi:hypothetical protein